MQYPDEWPWYERIKYERLCLGLSQREAARELDYDERALRGWEAGEHFPSYQARRALCKLYGKTVKELDLLRPGW